MDTLWWSLVLIPYFHVCCMYFNAPAHCELNHNVRVYGHIQGWIAEGGEGIQGYAVGGVNAFAFDPLLLSHSFFELDQLSVYSISAPYLSKL